MQCMSQFIYIFLSAVSINWFTCKFDQSAATGVLGEVIDDRGDHG